MRKLLIIYFCLINCSLFCENRTVEILFVDRSQNVICSETLSEEEFQGLLSNSERPNPVRQLFKKKHKLNKKITSAVLAFPFPFGIVGLHRIYLGTKPYVPVAYIASLGGVFGILPFIDFCAIILDKDFDHYKNNGKVFMWVRD